MLFKPENIIGENDRSIEDVQNERKEYVKNIGIEYRYGCYEEKNADSCNLLADFREAIELNFKSAFRLYQENCQERQHPKSCFKYAKYLLRGRECEPNIKKMIKPLEIACDGKINGACKLLALVHWNGDKEREPDVVKAERFQKIACDLGDGEACWILSTWYMGTNAKFKKLSEDNNKDYIKGKLKKNMYEAIKYGIRACEHNVFQSCANISRIYKIGDGVPKDPDKEQEFLQKAKEIIDNIKNGFDPGFTA